MKIFLRLSIILLTTCLLACNANMIPTSENVTGTYHYEKARENREYVVINILPEGRGMYIDYNREGNAINKIDFSWALTSSQEKNIITITDTRYYRTDSYEIQSENGQFILLASGKAGMGDAGDKWLPK